MQTLFDHASSVMTVASLFTFIGILAWTFLLRREADFAAAAGLPFADADAATDAGGESGDV